MLKEIDKIRNIDCFEIFNSELILNSNYRVTKHDSNQLLVEFNNRKKNRVSNFHIWDNKLLFSDVQVGERYIVTNSDVLSNELYLCSVLDNEYCLFNDEEFKHMILFDQDLKKVWQSEVISYYPAFCRVTDQIAFLKKNNLGLYELEVINKLDKTKTWDLKLHEYNVDVLGCYNGIMYMTLSLKNISENGEKYFYLHSLDMLTGKFKDKFNLRGEHMPHFFGTLKYDIHLSRFVSPILELDFETKTCYPRTYFKDETHLASIVGIKGTGVWNERYYVDCYNQENWNSEKKDTKEYPHKILVFDRLSDVVVSKTIEDDENNLTSIAQFKIDGNKLYARDTLKNLRIYDFSEYTDIIA